MKKAVFAVLALGAGCIGDFEHEAEERRLNSRGLSRSDLDGPPTDTEVRARIINDVRENRVLLGRLDEGTPTCANVRFENGRPVCVADRADMSVITIREDGPDKQHGVKETAYFCEKENAYWYRYTGGRESREVWMGPFPTGLRARHKD